jgi:hypothetical protein
MYNVKPEEKYTHFNLAMTPASMLEETGALGEMVNWKLRP